MRRVFGLLIATLVVACGSSTPTGTPGTGTTFVSVKRSGSGRVTSDVPGIDCGDVCGAPFQRNVLLTASPDPGFRFAGWGGACGGEAACPIARGAGAAVVTAIFDKEPPLPAGCDALLPGALPAPVEVWLGEYGLEGTSDASGERFLFTTAPAGVASPSRAYHFVHVEAGVATPNAVREIVPLNTSTAYVFPRSAASEPAGFDVFRTDGVSTTVVEAYGPDGTLLATRPLSLPLRDGDAAEETQYAVVPGGGIATVRSFTGPSGTSVHYGRYDARGEVLVSDVALDFVDDTSLQSWSVDLIGNVLVIAAKGNPFGTVAGSARWLDPRGAPLTPWFAIGDVYLRYAAFVPTPDGLALSSAPPLSFRDGEPGAKPAPDWFATRASTWLDSARPIALVRGGRAYAAWGGAPTANVPYGPCAEGMEILTAAGESCGCLAFSEVMLASGHVSAIGRDGSVIAVRPLPGASSGFLLYPSLLR